MKRIVFAALAVLALASCRNQKPLLPTVSGKAGEIMVVIGKSDWEGNIGDDLRALLAGEYPFLPTREPMYSLANVSHEGFGDLFKVHRNIVFFDIDGKYAESRIVLKNDIWATPQCVVQIAASSPEAADSLVCVCGDVIVSAIEQAERDRVIGATMKYENRAIHAEAVKTFGGAPHCPSGFKMRTITDNFAWIADDKQATTQGIFIYRYPASGKGDDFSYENLVSNRDRILEANVPGPSEGSYMITSTYWKPDVRFLRYKGRAFAELHGMWEVKGDFMGGPFVLQAFYSRDGKDIIVEEAWVYAPHDEKRQILRQTESLLYSWEWEREKSLETEK